MVLDPLYLDQIKGFEGYQPNPAWDYKQYSSGFGTRAQPGDENIPADQRKAIYEQRFQDEIGKAAASVDAFAPDLPQGVRAALTSLTYNAGPGWQQSGLGQAIKSGDLETARGIFPQYNKAGGEVNPGLVARREKELAWWGGQPQAAPASPVAASSGPLQITPQQAPIFPAQAPQVQPQQQQAPQGGDIFSQMPATGQPPPIFFAPRRSPDLSKLKAALGQAGGFSFPRRG